MVYQRKFWPSPKRRTLSASSDLRLFYEAMVFIDKHMLVSKKEIKEELSVRVKGLKFIKTLSDSGIENLIGELKYFNWIYAERSGLIERSDMGRYGLTPQGKDNLILYKENKRKFLYELILKMYKQYTIPVWFIDRLWKLNPEGQGQIIIPSPIKEWNPKSRNWNNNDWDVELEDQVETCFKLINKKSPGSFNIVYDLWVDEVKKAWNRQSSLKKRKGNVVQKFAPRTRLTLAMKEAAVTLLFSNQLPENENPDFRSSKNPLAPRTYMAWCPRLVELELITYTDFNPTIPGRIIAPVSVFKPLDKISEDYENINIKNLDNEFLTLHKPKWGTFRKSFMVYLHKVYKENYLRNKSLYVSIQNVRDEVCRQLRISSACFEEFLSYLIKESLDGDVSLIISIETDVREDQKSGYNLERKPVLIGGKFCSLIAITKQKNNKS